MSYIDKTLTVETIRGKRCLNCRWGAGSTYCEACMVGQVIRIVKDAEDLDLEPTREDAHMVWDVEKYGVGWMCSECHREILHAQQRYCAFCGARLDGTKEEK